MDTFDGHPDRSLKQPPGPAALRQIVAAALRKRQRRPQGRRSVIKLKKAHAKSASQKAGEKPVYRTTRFAATGLEPVHDDIQTQPHHVDKVPIPGSALEREMMFRSEIAA
jgi:hypothetical protein